MSRKYRQPGYQDKKGEREEGPRRQPRTSREGPRSPIMPAFHQVLRCALCGTSFPPDFTEITVSSRCPKCGADLHTCKNCVFFDPASRFECTQSISERIARKDVKNSCRYFQAQTAVEKETTAATQQPLDPRQAFERLFKK